MKPVWGVDSRGARGWLAALIAMTLAGCGYPYTPPALAPVDAPPLHMATTLPGELRQPVTILVSIDGFRPDYLDRGVTPRLTALARAGVTGPMRPSFPSKTFPNHWTLVTGLRPDRHGIVGNTQEDPARAGETFTMETDDPFWWNTAEPIWVTAEKAGIRTATMFWPGSNVAWGGTRGGGEHGAVTGGIRPSDWQQFNQAVSGAQRVAAVIDWLRRPAAERPKLVTLYFDTIDTAGHDGGPDAVATTQAVADVDTTIGSLVDRLAELGQPANLVIVADHGMAATSSERVIALDHIVRPADARIVEAGPYATLVPAPGRDAAVAQALLRPQAHMQCWRKGTMPQRFHYGANPRVPSFLCLADIGWLINKSAPTKPFAGGNHGYDNAAAEMRALFVAQGPAFRAGQRVGPFDNVAIAPLLRDLLGLPAGTALDGDDAPLRGALVR